MMAWMLYSAFMALMVAAAVRAAEGVVRFAGGRVRFVWAGGLLLAGVLSVTAGLRGSGVPAPGTSASRLGAVVRVPANVSWPGALRDRLERLGGALDAPLRGAIVLVRRVVPPTADRYAALFSVTFSLGLVLVLIGVSTRFRRARRHWPAARVQDVEVRVAPDIGPVIIGVLRPEIVVPAWLLARPGGEQRLVLTHETEHLRARDPLLLALGWSAVIVAPWNPALWYMLSRLRLAVELDCDARVLCRGALPQSYGSLLIDVAQHASALRLSALALAGGAAHLKQRIHAMTPIIPRFARVRAGLSAAFALGGLLVACQSTMPADQALSPVALPAAAAPTAAIVEVPKQAVRTPPARAPGARGRVARVPVAKPARATVPVLTDVSPLLIRQADSVPGVPKSTPLILLDGVRISMKELRSLDRTTIDRVEVLKGHAAATLYPEPEAANGVIQITTKQAP